MEDIDAHESMLTSHDDGFLVVKSHQWGTEKYELNHHPWFPIVLGALKKGSGEEPR